MINGIQLRNLDRAERTGEVVNLDSERVLADVVFREMGLTHEKLAKGFFASDMDGTMFRNNTALNITGDLGVVVFLEKLQDPTFWKFSPEQFEKLLLPKKYRELAEANNNDPKMQQLLDLLQDIVALYKIRRSLTERRLGTSTVNEPSMTDVTSEFALKMITFDERVKYLEAKVRALNPDIPEILMRVRFFAGTNIAEVKKRTRSVIDRSKGELPEPITLSLASTINYNRRVEDLDTLRIRPIVQINEEVRQMIARLSGEYRAFGSVITTNLYGIAATAVHGTDYNAHFDHIVGSKLGMYGEGENRRLHPQFSSPAVLGTVKRDEACKLETDLGRPLYCALGDSVAGDGEMGLHAISREGIFIVTGPKFETIQSAFEPYLVQAEKDRGINNARARTWAISYED